MLWAAELELSHPLDGRPLHFAQPPPPKFKAFLAHEAATWRSHHVPPGPPPRERCTPAF